MLCVRGNFKADGITTTDGEPGTYLDRCKPCSACPVGSERGSDLDPCVLLAGGSTSDTVSCTACPNGRYQDLPTEFRGSLYPGIPEYDTCSPCQVCPPGGDREQCGLASEGVCVPWGVPVVDSVTGSGRDGGSTTGGQPLIIEGFNFGGTEAAAAGFRRDDIVVRYGPKSAFDANPTASDGTLYTLDNGNGGGVVPSFSFSTVTSFAPCTVLEYNLVTKRGTIQCTTVEGIGKDHWLCGHLSKTTLP